MIFQKFIYKFLTVLALPLFFIDILRDMHDILHHVHDISSNAKAITSPEHAQLLNPCVQKPMAGGETRGIA